MARYENEEEKPPKNIEEIIANVVIFATVWSIGAILEETARGKFHEYMMDMIGGEVNVVEKFALDPVYEYS